MDVGSPISSVIPTLDGRVLVALAGTTGPLNLTSVHRLSGRGSLSGVRRVLRRLVDTGIVIEGFGGYALNREHLAAPAINDLAQIRGKLFDRIRRAVSDWPQPPLLVGVFGSTARGDGDETSDIDLVVVSDEAQIEDRGAELAEAVQRWTGNNAKVIALTASDLARLNRTGEAILAEWERDLVTVVGSRSTLKTVG